MEEPEELDEFQFTRGWIVGIIIIVVLIIGFCIYWFAGRPALERHNCNRNAVKYADQYGSYNQNMYVSYYNECVEVKGIGGTIPEGGVIPVQ